MPSLDSVDLLAVRQPNRHWEGRELSVHPTAPVRDCENYPRVILDLGNRHLHVVIVMHMHPETFTGKPANQVTDINVRLLINGLFCS